MAPSHTSPSSPDLSKTYAIAASKGFSYLLPLTAQSHLTSAQKLLPPPARAIYNELYRDIMCAKACAGDSAVALKAFVGQFPAVKARHDEFARAMNKEIGGHVHEGYEPVLFPILGDAEAGNGRVAEVERWTGRKRKRVAGVEMATSKRMKKVKKVTTKQMASPPLSDAAVSHSDSSSSLTGADEPSLAGALASSSQSPDTSLSLLPRSDQVETPPLSTNDSDSASSSADQSWQNTVRAKNDTATNDGVAGNDETVNHDLTANDETAGIDKTEDDLRVPQRVAFTGTNAADEVLDNMESGSDDLPEDLSWEDGLRAIEEFDWEGMGSVGGA